MDVTTAIVILVALLLVATAAWFYLSRRRSMALRTHYGPEYDRLVRETDRRHAEAELQRRTQRVRKLSIRPLHAQEQGRYAEMWRQRQAQFVDDPGGAVLEAQTLVEDVMRARGYPMGNFEQQADDVSVDHPQVVQNYRGAHEIAQRHRHGQATTEDLRNAMIYYRALFDDLLEGAGSATEVRTR